jgi:putative membrane protein
MSDGESSASASTELAGRRTGMAFQRTRLAAERTLMGVIRTSLSLIGFGFTIFQFFEKLKSAGTIKRSRAPHNFGLALVLLGVGILSLGLIYHLHFMLQLRKERQDLIGEKLIHGNSSFPLSMVFLIASLLLTLGLLALISMTWNVGPFGED